MKNEINAKQLMVVVLIVALCFLVYYFVYMPLNKEIEALKIHRNDLNSQLVVLQGIQGNDKTLTEQKNKIVENQKDFLKNLPKELKEERTILTLMQVIKSTPGLQVQAVSVAKPEIVATDDAPNATMKLQITGIGKYSVIMNFLKNIKECKPRVTAENLNMSSAQSVLNPNINFNLQLVFFGYNGKLDEEYVKLSPELKDFDAYKYKGSGLKSKTNLFDPAGGGGGIPVLSMSNNSSVNNGPATANDFYVIINPAKFDMPGVSAEKAGSGSKSINNPSNGLSKVEFVFDSKNGQYFYKYKIGGKSYPANYANTEKFVPVDASGINLRIKGNQIMQANDNVAAEVSIINNTNLSVYVNVEGVKQDSQKLKIIKTKGLVLDTWN